MLAELEALEDLHNFRTTKVNADLFEYVYASLFHVSIPCKKFIPKVSTISITRYGKASTRYKDDFPKLSAFFLKTAQWLVSEGDKKTVREVGTDFPLPQKYSPESDRLFIVLEIIGHPVPNSDPSLLCSTSNIRWKLSCHNPQERTLVRDLKQERRCYSHL